MIKIALYLENSSISGADISNPENGNPGIGGTEFLFATLPYYFNKHLPNKIDFTLYANSNKNLPGGFEITKVESIIDAIEKAEKNSIDIFIWRAKDSNEVFEKFSNTNLKVIVWAHNTPYSLLNRIYKNDNFKRIVFVSWEQLDEIRDHKVFNKSTYIFNGFENQNFIPRSEIEKESGSVTYIGNLIPSKGFHYLAECWPRILKKVPSAKLYVIGNGQIYNENQKLGELNIAEDSYEQKFKPFLTDSNGDILPSVNFLGKLGNEKIKFLQKSMVGVANPTGKTERCPGTAIEIQAAGTAIVSGAYEGLLDTVKHKETGLLGKTKKQFVKNIVKILNNPKYAHQLGKNGTKFIKSKFDYQQIINKWDALFEEVINDRPQKIIPPKNNYLYREKIIRELLRVIKKTPMLKSIPALIEIKKIYIPKLKNNCKSILRYK